jgi:hypothetical protein
LPEQRAKARRSAIDNIPAFSYPNTHMKLDEQQKQQVARWLNEGLKLADVQKRLEQEFGISLTYMEVKFLVSDLDLQPKDPEPEKPAAPPAAGEPPAGKPMGEDMADDLPLDDETNPPTTGGVQVAVDQLARPGAMISGKVTFANGKSCEWMLDQMGRLGLVPAADGFKPGPEDLRNFQVALQVELQKLGF